MKNNVNFKNTIEIVKEISNKVFHRNSKSNICLIELSSALVILFAAAKLFGSYTDMSWLMVFSPIIIKATVKLALALGLSLLAVLADILEYLNDILTEVIEEIIPNKTKPSNPKVSEIKNIHTT